MGDLERMGSFVGFSEPLLVRVPVCTRLAQLVRSLTANQKVPGSIPGLVKG